MKKCRFVLLFCLLWFTAPAQETELFLSTRSGSPFANSLETDGFFWNWSLGVEQYMADKLSVSIAYRKMFDLGGDFSNYVFTGEDNTYGYRYTYNQDVNSWGIDIESKYFFENPAEEWYLASGFSFQHLGTVVTVTNVDVNSYGGSITGPSQVNVGKYEDGISIFPISFKAGRRFSSDTFVFDYFFGLSYNLGAASAVHKYGGYFEYTELKSISWLLGIKAGFKI